MPRKFKGGLKYEVQNDKRNLREFLLARPVMDNKGVYIHLSNSLKRFYPLLQLSEEVLESLVFRLKSQKS